MSELTETGLARQVQVLRAELAARGNTAVLAQACGAEMTNDQLRLLVWGRPVLVSAVDFVARDAASGAALDPLTQALITYYLHTSDGTPPADQWISFTELPDGRFYTRAFQGYTGRELAQRFGDDVGRLRETAVNIGGRPVPFASAACQFWPLPRVPLLLAAWQGDDDLPTSVRILFDAHTPHHLPTDACAILGSMLTRRLLHESSH